MKSHFLRGLGRAVDWKKQKGEFYVYAYFCAETGAPVYFGKGKNNRADGHFKALKQENLSWK